MIRAMVKNGIIQPLEPLPPEWQNGREVVVADAAEENGHAAAGEPRPVRGARTHSPAADLGKRFSRLVRQWRKETQYMSSVKLMAAHPAYQEIIDMKEQAVPLLLAELRKKPDHWFFALHKITGANPVPTASQGNVKEMAAAWLQWGKEEGYIE